VPLLPRVLCCLSSLLASVRTVMPEGSCVKARPRGAHQQDGHRGLAASAGHRAGQASLGAGGLLSQALRVTGDRRHAHVPDAAQAWAGGQRGGSVPPHPSRVAALRGWTNGLLLTGLCTAVSPAGPVLPHRQPAVLLGTQSITFNPTSRRAAGAGELARPRRCLAAAHSPQKKTSEEVFSFFTPKTKPYRRASRAGKAAPYRSISKPGKSWRTGVRRSWPSGCSSTGRHGSVRHPPNPRTRPAPSRGRLLWQVARRAGRHATAVHHPVCIHNAWPGSHLQGDL
jgi:hypothetical protein